VGLGTSVLILPYRHPVHLAKELASLDQLSGGRLTLGAGAGWLEGEFEALGLQVSERGARSDEYLDALRACWGPEDPFSFHGPTVSFDAMKVRPKPAHAIPVWVGGSSPAALTRAAGKGDGWHGNLSPADAKPVVAELRARRPEETFTLSMRTAFDGLNTPEAEIVADTEALAALGVQHLITMPVHSELDQWLRSVEELWRILSPYRELSPAS
jgi:probable F420-dependent oxidoreductase